MTDRKISIPKGMTLLTPQEEILEPTPKYSRLFIGIPREYAFQENRIPLTPSSVAALTRQGHRIVIEAGAGEKARFTDHEYAEAGAQISYSREDVFKATTLLKVAPPSLEDIELCFAGQVIVSPIHLPTLSAEYIYRLKHKRVIALAIEYIKDQAGTYPFVRSMSEMAGISAVQTGAELLSIRNGGRGVLLGGISGVPPAKVVILGAGVVAEFATKAALGLGAEVRVFDNNVHKLMRLQHNVGRSIYTSTLAYDVLQRELADTDLAIGAIHAENGRSPLVVSEEMVEQMKNGAVIVDVSIDQGGCFATSKVTTHEQPTYRHYDVIHYCVPNIASRIPRTGSVAFSNILTTLLQEAEGGGLDDLLRRHNGLRNGVYAYKGTLTNQHLGERFAIKSTNLNLLLASER